MEQSWGSSGQRGGLGNKEGGREDIRHVNVPQMISIIIGTVA